jgi:hypothetical protein
VKNDAVVTFEDQSMLFAILEDGYLCIGNVPAVFELNIIGGTGKYSNVTGGRWTGTFFTIPFGASGSFFAETGSIVGEIYR